MSDQSADEAADIIVRAIRMHLEDQIRWHLQHGSQVSRDRLLDIANRLESQKLELWAERAEKEGSDAVADAFDAIREDLLPAIVHELRSKRR